MIITGSLNPHPRRLLENVCSVVLRGLDGAEAMLTTSPPGVLVAVLQVHDPIALMAGLEV